MHHKMQRPPEDVGRRGDLGNLEQSLDTSDHDESQGMIGLDEGLFFARYADSYTRIPTTIGIFWRMKYSDSLTVLGESWSG